MAIRKIKGSYVSQDVDDYVGEETYIFYDVVTGDMRIWDGTPGGTPILGGGGGGTWGSIGGDINNQTDLITLFGNYILATEKGAANGVATLDAGGLVPASQLPSYVDDVLEYANLAAFPVTGEVGKIYVALDTNDIYRWSGATYISISTADATAELGYLRTFVGKTAAGSELPTYSSTNYVTQSNSLESAIGELDAAIQTVSIAAGDDGFIRAFIGKGAAGSELPIYTSTNYVTQNNNLEAAISELDAALTTVTSGSDELFIRNFIGKDNTGNSNPNYISNNYITNNGNLELAIGELDAALTTIDGSIPNAFSTIVVSGQSNVVADIKSDTLTLVAGTNISLTTNAATDAITINAASPNLWSIIQSDVGSATANIPADTLQIFGGTGISTAIVGDTLTITNDSPNVDQNLFANIAVSGQSTIAADTTADTLTLVGGTNITITTNAATDEITFSASVPANQNLFETVAADTGSVVADNLTDTLTLAGGTGISTTATPATDTITFDLNAILNDLTDVVITTPADNELLAFDLGSGDWINQTAAEAGLATTTDLGNYIPTSEKGAANGVATLDAGAKIPTSQLPALALTDVWVVADEPSQLALVAQEGDIAIRSDLNKSYAHNGGVSGTMADWSELLTPTDAVLSVNGQTGTVSINLWETFNADSGTTTANTTTDTLTIAGGTGISTAIVGDTLTITNDSPNVDQNLFATVAGDTGSTTANTTTDTLTIAGGNGITTSVSGDTVTITADGVSNTINNTNITTITTIDTVVSVAAKWLVRAYEVATPANVVAEEIFATHDGSTTKISEGSVLKMGSTINGLTFTVTLTGGNTLNLNVTSTAAVNVDVKRIAAI